VRKIRNKELPTFTLRLSAMLDAGLPLLQCLDALGEQCESAPFRVVIEDIAGRIEAGDNFGEALSPYQVLFGDLYISMIKAGEAGGGLAEVTARLGAYMEASASMRKRIKAAMTYPVIVLTLSLILSAAMILFIVPKFASIFADFDAKLPAPTRVLVQISDIMRHNAPVALAILVALVFAVKWLKKTPKGSLFWDTNVLRAPVAGPLIRKTALARMCRTFASLVRSGVPILKTFEIVSKATDNGFFENALVAAGHDVEGGASITAALRKTGIFPPMVVHMVSAGEQTGKVDHMMEKVADFYEEEVATALESLSSMIEPLLMVFLGVVIGGIVICMFLPVFKMHEIVGS
jgi:type IV pilus assembly protein PilC